MRNSDILCVGKNSSVGDIVLDVLRAVRDNCTYTEKRGADHNEKNLIININIHINPHSVFRLRNHEWWKG